MTSKEDLIQYINSQVADGIELKHVNDTMFIKFDFLPYKIREFIHSQEDYDKSKMLLLDRDCGCGYAYYLDEQHFFDLLTRIDL